MKRLLITALNIAEQEKGVELDKSLPRPSPSGSCNTCVFCRETHWIQGNFVKSCCNPAKLHWRVLWGEMFWTVFCQEWNHRFIMSHLSIAIDLTWILHFAFVCFVGLFFFHQAGCILWIDGNSKFLLVSFSHMVFFLLDNWCGLDIPYVQVSCVTCICKQLQLIHIFFIFYLCTVYHTDRGASVLGSVNGFFTCAEPLPSLIRVFAEVSWDLGSPL